MNYHNIFNTEEGLFAFGCNSDTKNRLVPIKLKGEYEIISFNKKIDKIDSISH